MKINYIEIDDKKGCLFNPCPINEQTEIKSSNLRDLIPVVRQQFYFGVEVVPICELKTLWVKRYLMRLINRGSLNDSEYLAMQILTEELIYIEKKMQKHEKARLYKMMVLQFPRALKAIARRSEIGHEKYADIDQDWQGFTITPIEQYQDAIIRHLMNDGESHETELDHAAAVAWNAIAILELKLREKDV